MKAGVKGVQGGKLLHVQTSGRSASPDIATTKEAKLPEATPTATKPPEPAPTTGTKPTGGKQQDTASAPKGRPQPIPESAGVREQDGDECRQIVGDIYGGMNKESNSGILDHKLDAVVGMQTVLDKADAAVSSNVVFFISLVTNAAAGALGAGFPTIVANALIWARQARPTGP